METSAVSGLGRARISCARSFNYKAGLLVAKLAACTAEWSITQSFLNGFGSSQCFQKANNEISEFFATKASCEEVSLMSCFVRYINQIASSIAETTILQYFTQEITCYLLCACSAPQSGSA